MLFLLSYHPFLMKIRLKDYYRTLNVSPNATSVEIRKVFRQLALKYHPDRNPESPFAAGHFIEIKEAYHVLGDEQRRGRYDEERWLLGMNGRRPANGKLSAEWVREEAAKLKRHIEQIDTYRMNHDALQQYVLLLLSDAHLSVVENSRLLPEVVKDTLSAVTRLKMPLLPPVVTRLRTLAGNDDALQAAIQALWQERKKREQREKTFNALMVFFVLLFIVIGLVVLAI